MGEKIKRGIKKYKNKFIVALILWIILSIVFVAPTSIAIKEATENGGLNWQILFETIGAYITKPFTSLGTAFGVEYIGSFWGFLWKFTLAYIVLMTFGIIKAMPKHEYDDIEHGSSDWSEGEEYKVLNKNKGIILAEKEYLPVDKRRQCKRISCRTVLDLVNLHHMLYQMHINYLGHMYLLILRENYMIKHQVTLSQKGMR